MPGVLLKEGVANSQRAQATSIETFLHAQTEQSRPQVPSHLRHRALWMTLLFLWSCPSQDLVLGNYGQLHVTETVESDQTCQSQIWWLFFAYSFYRNYTIDSCFIIFPHLCPWQTLHVPLHAHFQSWIVCQDTVSGHLLEQSLSWKSFL